VTVKFVSDAPDLTLDMNRGASAAVLTEEVSSCAHVSIYVEAPAHHSESR
jgi:hypothetical protein